MQKIRDSNIEYVIELYIIILCICISDLLSYAVQYSCRICTRGGGGGGGGAGSLSRGVDLWVDSALLSKVVRLGSFVQSVEFSRTVLNNSSCSTFVAINTAFFNQRNRIIVQQHPGPVSAQGPSSAR